jgi:hypothetical protein
MLELLALALFQFATLVSSPTTTTAKGGSSGWNDGNITTAKGGSSGWNDGNVTTAGGSSGWNDGNARKGE